MEYKDFEACLEFLHTPEFLHTSYSEAGQYIYQMQLFHSVSNA